MLRQRQRGQSLAHIQRTLGSVGVVVRHFGRTPGLHLRDRREIQLFGISWKLRRLSLRLKSRQESHAVTLSDRRLGSALGEKHQRSFTLQLGSAEQLLWFDSGPIGRPEASQKIADGVKRRYAVFRRAVVRNEPSFLPLCGRSATRSSGNTAVGCHKTNRHKKKVFWGIDRARRVLCPREFLENLWRRDDGGDAASSVRLVLRSMLPRAVQEEALLLRDAWREIVDTSPIPLAEKNAGPKDTTASLHYLFLSSTSFADTRTLCLSIVSSRLWSTA
ncbi:hypothetical protein B0T26DRAFT_173016 [Lasiosphaeria miniovina]|uniref:Uncharacterized protein n=1 Tax=Lasiosphaeria miniovina TaxID=1954250 RepID=A0AA40B6I0_9PEZI|nr:uncharacterized protein B0T26DRAFT_173016 [Lasiosphaeria miniovina]KAK0728477.1 hypothetical protein B0T26DRAFT_173016 [Lasiosphaeria miniovina]